MRGWRGVRLLGVGVFVYRDRGGGGAGSKVLFTKVAGVLREFSRVRLGVFVLFCAVQFWECVNEQ
jgi:hypothetical protein